TQLSKLSIATSVESMFTRHDQILTDYQRFRSQFGRDEEIVLLISSSDIFSLEFLTTLKQFHEDLENSLPLLKEVSSLVNAPYIESVDGGVHVGGFLDNLPSTKEEAQQYRLRGHSYPGFQNVYFTPDGKHAIVVIKTQAVSALAVDGLRLRGYARGVHGAEAPPPPAQQQSISQVENIAVNGIVEAVIKEYQAPNFNIAFSGTPVYQYHVEPMVRSNMKKMCIGILIVSVLFMPFLFGRGTGAILPPVTAILGLMIALGLMALLSVRFSLTSSMLPSILLSIGLTAPIHFLVVYYKHQKQIGKFRGIIATMGHSGFPISMTSFTTVAGLLSFSFSDIVPIAELVNFTVVGILATLVFTLVTMPAFLSILQVVAGVKKGEADYEASVFNRTLLAIGRLGVNRPYLVLCLFLAVILVVGIRIPKLHFSHNELDYFTEDSDFMRQVRLIEAKTGGFRALELLIDTQREQGIIDHDLLQAMAQLNTNLKSETDIQGRAYVGRTRSLVDLIREISCVTNGRDQGLCPVPKDDSVLAEQFDQMNRSAPAVLRKYTDDDFQVGRLTAMMYWKDAAHDVDFIAQVREYAATLFDSGVNVVVTGVVSINAVIINAMMTSLAIGYSTGFLLITVLMILAIGDVRLGLLAMIPNLLPIIIALGVMGYLDIPLNTYNLIGGSIVIGLAVDDTIHFFHNFRRYYQISGDINFAVSETLGSAGRALMATTLILVSSFWMRLFSDLKVVADFGLVMGVALLVAFLADVLLAPALLRMFYGNGKMVSFKGTDSPEAQTL
ncbi:MAG: MMPL family transporter, partial [Gammaproteobacteria bacterium]|nr:MMPL family transporter [Gammaproteobacteria bacterium]